MTSLESRDRPWHEETGKRQASHSHCPGHAPKTSGTLPQGISLWAHPRHKLQSQDKLWPFTSATFTSPCEGSGPCPKPTAFASAKAVTGFELSTKRTITSRQANTKHKKKEKRARQKRRDKHGEREQADRQAGRQAGMFAMYLSHLNPKPPPHPTLARPSQASHPSKQSQQWWLSDLVCSIARNCRCFFGALAHPSPGRGWWRWRGRTTTRRTRTCFLDAGIPNVTVGSTTALMLDTVWCGGPLGGCCTMYACMDAYTLHARAALRVCRNCSRQGRKVDRKTSQYPGWVGGSPVQAGRRVGGKAGSQMSRQVR